MTGKSIYSRFQSGGFIEFNMGWVWSVRAWKLKVKNPNVKNSEPIIHSCILKCLAAIVRMDKYFIRRVTP